MSGRQNGCAVFQRHSDGLRLEIGSQSELVTHRGDQRVAWRHLPCIARGAHRLHGAVLTAVSLPAVDVEVVACNACKSGRGTGIDATVSGSRHCRYVVIVRVVAVITFCDESFQTVVAEFVVIAVEIVPSHLVNHDAHHQFRAF